MTEEERVNENIVCSTKISSQKNGTEKGPKGKMCISS